MEKYNQLEFHDYEPSGDNFVCKFCGHELYDNITYEPIADNYSVHTRKFYIEGVLDHQDTDAHTFDNTTGICTKCGYEDNRTYKGPTSDLSNAWCSANSGLIPANISFEKSDGAKPFTLSVLNYTAQHGSVISQSTYTPIRRLRDDSLQSFGWIYLGVKFRLSGSGTHAMKKLTLTFHPGDAFYEFYKMDHDCLSSYETAIYDGSGWVYVANTKSAITYNFDEVEEVFTITINLNKYANFSSSNQLWFQQQFRGTVWPSALPDPG